MAGFEPASVQSVSKCIFRFVIGRPDEPSETAPGRRTAERSGPRSAHPDHRRKTPVRASNCRVGPLGSDVGPEILEACRRDDREALRALYDAYKDRVYSIAYYFLRGDHAAAADVTQQVFLKLMSGLGNYRGGAAFSTWLYRIVINTCIDSRRRASRLTAVAPETLQAIVDPQASRDDVIASEERARSVHAAIAALPPKLRAPVLLRYVSDLGYPEIARVLNCSIGTVSSRLHRAHRLLAERLAPLRLASPRGESR